MLSFAPFDMENIPSQPARMRQLGRPRTYTCADLPRRLTHWHAPRANRWEQLCVTTGQLCTQWLDTSGATPLWLQAGSSRWIAPGTCWYVAHMNPDTRFELQIYADDATPVSAPQPLRTTLLDAAVRTRVDDVAAFTHLATDLAIGDARLLQGCFDCNEVLNAILTDSGQCLLWHPLCASSENFTAFLALSAQPVGLLDYLGHDHAVIEAALAGALRGDAEYTDWLHAVLARHLAIEEQLLFPAYIEAGVTSPGSEGSPASTYC